MTTTYEGLLNDSREIEGLYASNGDSIAQVGRDGVTKIECYGEGGMHCDIPWMRVFRGERISKRVSAHSVAEVYYKVEAVK